MRPELPASAGPALILLAPMESLLDDSLRAVQTSLAGIDRCVSEFIPIIVNRHRGGAVLLDDPALVGEIVAAVRRAVPVISA